MSRVFVIQIPAKRKWPENVWIEKYDLSPAEKFGKLVRVLPPGNVADNLEPTHQAFREHLSDFDNAEDFVILLGDPVACARAVHFLAMTLKGQCFKALKWDRQLNCYLPYTIG